MKKTRFIILLILITGLSSCGIFKKDCGCPHFGKNVHGKKTENTIRYV
jgi:hypothetical protein